MKKFLLQIFPWFFVIAGLFITIFFFSHFTNEGYTFGTKEITLDSAVKYASFIGGIVGPLISAAGFCFLYLNLSEQRNSFYIERLESKFFEMIKFHRDNIDQMSYTYCEHPNTKEMVTAEKRKVFRAIHQQFEAFYNEVNFLFLNKTTEDIYEVEYLGKVNRNNTIKERGIDLVIYAKLDIIYLAIFFGVSKDGIKTILQYTANKYHEEFVTRVLLFAALKPKKEYIYWGNWADYNKFSPEHKILKFNSIISDRKTNKNLLGIGSIKIDSLEKAQIYQPDSYTKYYGGHEFRLGHYFRNFYQAVKCIHDDPKLDHLEKYNYIKILRGQSSNVEQLLFFLNSISQLGRVWELEKKSRPDKAVHIKNQLVTVYNLIKNLPNQELIDGILYKSFYPLESFESSYDEGVKERRKWLKRFF